eukprot:TRINITY_DN260_c0_g1_i3.p1 TRINITY_DN260_c0_g1~~TRINITY_DN260_c0_g1_i3.p1  ORF type:complete len:262 (+),score=18.64 TRINITY_DN260_c0_g1_i3:880-1665(+)
MDAPKKRGRKPKDAHPVGTQFHQHASILCTTTWHDIKPVCFLSTLDVPVKSNLTVRQKRMKAGKDILFPTKCIFTTPQWAEPTLGDAVTKRHKRTLMTSKWPLKVFSYLLDKSLANARLVWKEALPPNTLSTNDSVLTPFKEAVIEGLLGRLPKQQLKSTTEQAAPIPCPETQNECPEAPMRRDSTFWDHFPEKVVQRAVQALQVEKTPISVFSLLGTTLRDSVLQRLPPCRGYPPETPLGVKKEVPQPWGTYEPRQEGLK